MTSADSGELGFYTVSATMGHEKAYQFPVDKYVLIMHVAQDGLELAERVRTHPN